MGQLEKLVDRIRARPPEADFADVERLLKAFGYERKRQEGSHVGARTVTVPLVSGRKVKRVYLDKLCELLGLDE